MKNHKNPNGLVHSLLGLVRKELEITLAILVLLAFVVGFSFAQTATPEASTSDTQVASTQSSKLVYNGTAYNGISFGSAQPGMLPIKGFTGGSQYFTANLGLTLVSSSTTYTLQIPLGAELDVTQWYADVDGANININVNGQVITSATQGISLAGAKQITITTKGGINIRRFSHVPGSTAPSTTQSVQTLFLAPNSTSIMVDQTRSFLVIALDAAGNSVNTTGQAQWSVSNTNVATISSTTGLLTAKSAGKVEVTVTVGTAKATATVTVQEKAEIVEITNTAAKSQIVAQPVTSDTKTETATQTPASSTTTKTETTTDAAQTSEVATPSTVGAAIQTLFSKEAIAARVVAEGVAYPTQAQIDAVATSLPTPTAKFAFRITAAAREIGLTVKTMFVGNTTTNPTTGETIVTPSAPRVVANFVLDLLGLRPGAHAGTTRIGSGEEGLN